MEELYTLRYRQGTTGAVTSYITATSQEKADEVGKWFCNQQPNRRFIRVEPAIVARESDLNPAPVEVVPEAPKQPLKKSA